MALYLALHKLPSDASQQAKMEDSFRSQWGPFRQFFGSEESTI